MEDEAGRPVLARSNRLMDLMRILRDGRLHRAEDMARRLGVSPRTIYRDLSTLQSSGIPIEGARGIGYRATSDITLPPLNLTSRELEALHVGLAAVGAGGDPELGAAARDLSAKIEGVLPEGHDPLPRGFGFAAYPFEGAALAYAHIPAIRSAIRARQKIRVVSMGRAEILRPLELDYWGRAWTLTAWSEDAADFSDVRVDAITSLKVLQQLFLPEKGKRLEDRPAG